MAKGGFRANAGRKSTEEVTENVAPKERGGFRPGAGRKAGTKNKRTDLQDALAANAVTAQELGVPKHIAEMSPLAVMACVMTTALYEGHKQLALSAASQLAPYLSPRLQHVTSVTTTNPQAMSDNELQALLAQLKAKAEDIGPQPEPEPEPVLFRAAA